VLFSSDITALHVGGTSRALPIVTEWHKAKGFVRYFHKFFETTYSPALLRLISAAVFLRMVVRSIALTARWPFAAQRPHRARPATTTPGLAGD